MALYHANIMRDALYNLHPQSGATPEYAQGLLVGVASALMAQNGYPLDRALTEIRPHLPRVVRLAAIPDTWVEMLKEDPISRTYL